LWLSYKGLLEGSWQGRSPLRVEQLGQQANSVDLESFLVVTGSSLEHLQGLGRLLLLLEPLVGLLVHRPLPYLLLLLLEPLVGLQVHQPLPYLLLLLLEPLVGLQVHQPLPSLLLLLLEPLVGLQVHQPLPYLLLPLLEPLAGLQVHQPLPYLPQLEESEPVGYPGQIRDKGLDMSMKFAYERESFLSFTIREICIY
jgi:hypothetical protein